MNAAVDLQQNLQAMSSGSHTESHEDILRSSHLTGSEDDLNFAGRDQCSSNSDLTKHVHRVSEGRSYTNSPIEFSQSAVPNFPVKIVDVDKDNHANNSGLDDEMTANDSTSSIRSYCTAKDPRASTVVIPRGQKGFGIFLVEGEVRNNYFINRCYQ